MKRVEKNEWFCRMSDGNIGTILLDLIDRGSSLVVRTTSAGIVYEKNNT